MKLVVLIAFFLLSLPCVGREILTGCSDDGDVIYSCSADTQELLGSTCFDLPGVGQHCVQVDLSLDYRFPCDDSQQMGIGIQDSRGASQMFTYRSSGTSNITGIGPISVRNINPAATANAYNFAGCHLSISDSSRVLISGTERSFYNQLKTSRDQAVARAASALSATEIFSLVNNLDEVVSRIQGNNIEEMESIFDIKQPALEALRAIKRSREVQDVLSDEDDLSIAKLQTALSNMEDPRQASNFNLYVSSSDLDHIETISAQYRDQENELNTELEEANNQAALLTTKVSTYEAELRNRGISF